MAATKFFLLSSENLRIHSLLWTTMNCHGWPFPELGARQVSLRISLTTSGDTARS